MAAALKRIREAKGLSPARVAADLGIGVRTLFRHEADETPLTPMQARAYADYLGCKPAELLEEEAA